MFAAGGSLTSGKPMFGAMAATAASAVAETPVTTDVSSTSTAGKPTATPASGKSFYSNIYI